LKRGAPERSLGVIAPRDEKKEGCFIPLAPRRARGAHYTPCHPKDSEGLINFGFKKEEEGCS